MGRFSPEEKLLSSPPFENRWRLTRKQETLPSEETPE